MSISNYYAQRFREALLDGDWVCNTNFKDQLLKTPYEIAIKRVLSSNSISVLTQHIHYYVKGVLVVLEGGELVIKDSYSFDFPKITSESQWKIVVDDFINDAKSFANLLESLPENIWHEPFVDKKYGTYAKNIDGMIAHCYYHLGQIVLLNKQIHAH